MSSNVTPAEVWQNVITERFLVRLCRSPYHTHFVLKGGTLLARYVDISRETKDLDFAIQRLSNEINTLRKTFNDIPDQDLKREFICIISDLSRMELIILEALEGRRRGEVLSLSSRGGTFLRGDLIINDISLAWIDSLIRKGLVIDASVENVQWGYTPNAHKVASRSAIRLSDLARSMIEYMRSLQSTNMSEI